MKVIKQNKKPKIDKILLEALEKTKKKMLDDAPITLKFVKSVANAKKGDVIIYDKRKPTKKEIEKWANQKITIDCTMHKAGDLMDLLFMADGGPFNGYFRDTIKLNKMEKSYEYWLNKMVDIVCKEDLKKDGKSCGIQQNKK